MKNTTSQVIPVEKGTYVSRKVRNPEILYNFFKDQGVNVVPMNELHCTIAYSKKEFLLDVDHNEITIKPEQLKSKLEPLGDEGAVVLKFESDEMVERFNHCIKKGATYDYPKYIPHISISYDGKDLDLKKIKVPNFDIILYDEKSEELNLDWKAKILTESANYRIILKPLDKLLTELDIIIGEIDYRLSRKVFDNLSRLNLLYNRYLNCILDISKLLKSYSNNYKFEANNLIMKYFDMNFKNLSESSKDLANKFKNIIDKLNSSQDANSSLNFNQLNFEIKDNLLFNTVKNKKGKIKMENSEVLNINEIFMESLFDDEIQQEILMENSIDKLKDDYIHRIQMTSDQSSLRRLGSSIANDNILSIRYKRMLTGEIAKKLGNVKLESEGNIAQNSDIKKVTIIQSILKSIGLGNKLENAAEVISYTADNKAIVRHSRAIESLNESMDVNGWVGVTNIGISAFSYIIACKLAKASGLPVGSYRNILTNFKVFLSINPFKPSDPMMVKIWVFAMLSILNALVGGKNIQIAISAYFTKKKLVTEYQTESLSFTKQLEAIDLMESYSPRRAVLSMRMFDDLIKRKGISSKTKSSFSELVNYVQDRNEFKQDSSLSQAIRKEYGESFDDYKARYNKLFSKV